MPQFTIPEISKDILKLKVSKWNKKAAKLGVDPIELNFGIAYQSDKYTDKPISVINFDVIGEIPHYDGWEFISKVDHKMGSPLFSTAPYKSLPKHLLETCTSNCEHCNSKRMRNTTYIVKKDDVYKNVGSTCIKDFFNQDIERHVNGLFNIFNEINEICNDLDGYSNAPQIYDTISILEYAFEEILKQGFVTKAAERENGDEPSTATWIELWVTMGKKEHKITPSTKAKELAKEALDWINEGITGDNEFVYNLKTLAKVGYLEVKYISFIAAGANSYFKKINAFVPNSEWVGEIKDKIETTVTVIGKKSWPNNYGGWTTLFRFKDDNDRLLVWFASNPPNSFEVDSILTIKGTIKKNDEYNDIKQTILTRVKEV